MARESWCVDLFQEGKEEVEEGWMERSFLLSMEDD